LHKAEPVRDQIRRRYPAPPSPANGAPAPFPRVRKRWLVAVGRGAMALAIFAYLFQHISLANVLDAASSAAPGPLLAAFLLALLAHVVIADRLRRLVQALGMRLSTLTLLQINLATVFYGLILPAGNVTGIIARFYRMSRREPNYAGIAVALAFERLAATLTLCLVGIAFWLVDWRADWPALILMLGALAALLLLHATLFTSRPPLLIRLRDGLGRWWPHSLTSLRQALQQSRSLPQGVVAKVFALSILTHGLGVVAYDLVASALSLDLSFATIAWTRSAAVLIAIVPISIAGLGVREGAMVVLLAPYGIAAADTLAYSLLAFATTILAVGLLGGLIEAWRFLRGQR
jgi:glycosyltransferase 2 family protein